jgi:hypothetical protein
MAWMNENDDLNKIGWIHEQKYDYINEIRNISVDFWG